MSDILSPTSMSILVCFSGGKLLTEPLAVKGRLLTSSSASFNVIVLKLSESKSWLFSFRASLFSSV